MKNPVLLTALFSLGAIAAAAAQTPAQLQSCSAIVSSVARLACYDHLAHGAPAAPSYAAPSYAPPPAYTPYTAPAQSFALPPRVYAQPAPAYVPQQMGAEQLRRPDNPGQGPQSLRLNVVDLAYTKTNHFIITLSDGEVWQQVEGEADRPDLHRKVARSVTITHGLFGSYNLVFSDQVGRYKVDRIK